MSRFVIMAPVAVVITVALFFLMRDLIAASPEQPEQITAEEIEILRKIKERPSEPRRRTIRPIEQEPPEAERPDHDTLRDDLQTTVIPNPGPTKLDRPGDFGPDLVDGPATPIIRNKPDYPACGRGTGEVLLDYVVDPDGSVVDVRVVSATSSCFARAAQRATTGWRYRPRIEEGEAVRSRRLRVKLVFEPE